MDREPSEDIIRKELAEVSGSRALQRSPQLQKMITYLVEEELSGRGDRIKAFNIAVDVFGRDSSFDASTDPIVRVQAARLRSALEDHYAIEGRKSLCRIELPKGGYVPTFTARSLDGNVTIDEPPAAVAPAELPSGSDMSVGEEVAHGGWLQSLTPVQLFAAAVGLVAIIAYLSSAIPTVSQQGSASVYRLMLVPFESSLDTAASQKILPGLDAELATSLTRPGLVDLVLASKNLAGQPEQILEAARQARAHWIVTGVFHRTETVQKVNVFLTDATTGGVVWSHSYQAENAATALVLVDAMILDLRLKLYASAKRAIEHKRAPDALDLFVLATWLPGSETNTEAWQRQRLDLARRAIAANKGFGPAHSVLADKLSLLANVVPQFDTEAVRAEASDAAREALLLAPNNPEVVFNLALYNLHTGRLDQAVGFLRRTLELSSRHSLAAFLENVIPFYCEPASNATIESLELYDNKLSPGNPLRWQTQLWRARLLFNAGKFEGAIEAADKSMRITPNLYASLIKLTSMSALGRAHEAPALYQEIKKHWPSFSFKHHNSVHLTRICGGSTKQHELLSLYRGAAEAVGAD